MVWKRRSRHSHVFFLLFFHGCSAWLPSSSSFNSQVTGLRAGALCPGRSRLLLLLLLLLMLLFFLETDNSLALALVHYCFKLVMKAGEAPAGLHLSCCFAALMIKCPLAATISHVNLPFMLRIVAALFQKFLIPEVIIIIFPPHSTRRAGNN